jgi:hypothetical protein
MTTLTYNLPWIESPFFNAELKARDLSEDDKAYAKHFADKGYIIFDPKIEESLIDKAVYSLSPKFYNIKENDKRLLNAWEYNKAVKEIASSEEVYKKLRLLYGREAFPFQTLNFPEGTQQRTHSDMIHFNSIPERYMCGVWIAFEDITNENGPLHYYPGSHKLPFYDMIDLGVKGSDNIETKKAMMVYLENYETFIEEIIQALHLKKEVLNIKKGQAIIWSANLLHGGEKIAKPGATRHSQVTHYYFEDCMYYCPRLSDIAINKLYLTDLVDIKTGKKVQSKYFGDEIIALNKNVYIKQKVVKMLSKVSHLFPKEIVNKIKSVVVEGKLFA